MRIVARAFTPVRLRRSTERVGVLVFKQMGGFFERGGDAEVEGDGHAVDQGSGNAVCWSNRSTGRQRRFSLYSRYFAGSASGLGVGI